MRLPLNLALSVFTAVVVFHTPTWGKDSARRPSDYKFFETPQEVLNPPEIGGSMFQAAAANTTVLGWWTFETPGGLPDEQGWTKVDLSVQEKVYWQVAGSACAASITPISGYKSMWCGQWPSAEDPWCDWSALPGYGNSWDQSLEFGGDTVTTLTYSIQWETEWGIDYTYLEWWDEAGQRWVADPTVNGGRGGYDGGPAMLVEAVTSPYGPTRVRFRFTSDGAWSDQDGMWPTSEGAVKVDDISVNNGPVEGFEEAACDTQSAGGWAASVPPGFGIYAHLVQGSAIVQEDPCRRVQSWLWAFFDDPDVTNYACGGWPLQGAVPYGDCWEGPLLDNEIRSPWVPIAGLGSDFILSFLSYRDLSFDENMVMYTWGVRTRDNDPPSNGCPGPWRHPGLLYYGSQLDWILHQLQIGGLVDPNADEIQVSLGAFDFSYTCCADWCGWCHSHAPLFDQVRLEQVELYGAQFTQRDIDMFHDNFPEDGTITRVARCDMAQDILPGTKRNILPGDSLIITVTDPNGLAKDNTGGRSGPALYAFVKCTDRFGNARPYTGLQMQSPDNRAWAADPNAGLLRYPLVTLGVTPPGWHAYRFDNRRTSWGSSVKNGYCLDLLDLAAGPDGPPYHPNENWAANTGVFVPGDVIWYFFGAQNTLGQWSFLGRTLNGQGPWLRTNNIMDLAGLDANGLPKGACEWSVLPDAGRLVADLGDILYVDDADDRGGPAQVYFDWAFRYWGLEDRVDRYDVLGPSSVVGNSLASRVKNISAQMIGDPIEIYQVVVWNSSELSRGLMGDGGTPNGGTSAEKSDDFGLAYTFLNTHPDNPGWAYWGDDVVEDWAYLTGLGAVNVKSVFMNHTLVTGNQTTLTGLTSPRVYATAAPFAENFYAYGGCPIINDFDSPGQTGSSVIAHRYNNATTGPVAALYQVTPNTQQTNARFFLAGFGFNFIRDDDTVNPPDYALHLKEILASFQNEIGQLVGIDPVAVNRLGHNYPNPFNPTTTIAYSIAERGHVTLKIYNAAGQLVRTLVDEEKAPLEGGFTADWDGTNDRGASVASGVYFYQLTAKDFSQTKKMVLLK